ncbi:hypothetical protein OG618_36595 [Kitasatospora sp. NBC_01246]|uniref:hypothetical protein n=1 Tax=Kitasatospora sp. NBC_01246 TaxID=2903570 RepID=UPI002E317302|nr:hypothetical protein [Kitasatospora sp. NBC_01246]
MTVKVHHGSLGGVWWRHGREGLRPLTDALDSPGDRAVDVRRRAEGRAEGEREHPGAMDLLACVDCGAVP